MLAVIGMMGTIGMIAMVATVALADAGGAQLAAAQELERIAYVIRIQAPDTHEIVVQARLGLGRSNGIGIKRPSTFITLAENAKRPHDVRCREALVSCVLQSTHGDNGSA